jgi:predicted metal-binding protein
MMNPSWRDITLIIGVKELMERFRDAERFIAYCKECGCYGRSWGCPPFLFDAWEYLSGWEVAEITATVITVPDGTPVSEAAEFITPQRARLDKWLLEREKETGGRAFSFVGNCLYCPGQECTRLCGRPCRHPDKVRPSLEAFGFDITAILADLFHLPLLWGSDGLLPPHLTLVTALFRK